jgi:Uma2 family endonuclease
MSVQTQPRLSPQEYLALERASEQRSEYLDGEVFAMGGASEVHNLIVTNLVRDLATQLLDRPCRVYSNDMRVKVEATGLYAYPDLVVVCGDRRFDDEVRDCLINPTFLVEVLSASTEACDRGARSGHYRHLESLAEYLLVSQHRPQVEHYARQEDGRWLLTDAQGLDAALDLPALGCRLALSEVYRMVEGFAAEGR